MIQKSQNTDVIFFHERLHVIMRKNRGRERNDRNQKNQKRPERINRDMQGQKIKKRYKRNIKCRVIGKHGKSEKNSRKRSCDGKNAGECICDILAAGKNQRKNPAGKIESKNCVKQLSHIIYKRFLGVRSSAVRIPPSKSAGVGGQPRIYISTGSI